MLLRLYWNAVHYTSAVVPTVCSHFSVPKGKTLSSISRIYIDQVRSLYALLFQLTWDAV